MGIECLYMSPNRIMFGQGMVGSLGDLVKEFSGKKAFIVTDKGVAGLDVFQNVINSLKEAELKYVVYDDVDANPTNTQVERGCELYKKEGADVIVAVGGGSSMDTAKALGVVVANGGSVIGYEGFDAFSKDIPPFIAIPTTAGTGSEVTPYAVITNVEDPENIRKIAVCGWKLMADVALVDPVMMSTMPPRITAATGMDALSHAVEAVWSNFGMPQTDALAFAAIKLVSENLEKAVKDGSDLDARDGMAMASLMGGMAMCAGCGAVHALGHQLSSQYNIHHGTAMSIMMPPVTKFNISSCPEKIAKIAEAMGEDISGLSAEAGALKAAEAIAKLGKAVGLPTTLSEAGATKELIPACAKFAAKDGDLPGNPVTPTIDQITDLYMEVF
ncbi:MAG: iron-containing alcohol dehydrogenase [Desulfobacterales bacterium]|nr:iron-containing alcohol dehydrogenase [Desulfobacterales bacterium]